MHNIDLILTLTGGLSAALIFGYVTHRLGLSPIVGYLTEDVIKEAREQNPRVQVMARTTHLRERDKLKAAGADLVFSGEGEVALAFTESILFRLGATAEQIDRERGRLHVELFGNRGA